MKRSFWLLVLAILIVITGSWSAQAQSERPVLRFGAHLTGESEVPPRETLAHGHSVLRLNPAETELSYKLIVDDIENVIAAHIHLGQPTVNGPVVAFLFGTVPPGGGPIEGLIAQGTITKANLVGPLAGQELSVLIAAMRSGGTYVNVHTNDGIDPANTGPGDFPGGEIRGTIIPRGSRAAGSDAARSSPPRQILTQ